MSKSIALAVICLSTFVYFSCLSTEAAHTYKELAPDIAPHMVSMDSVPDSPQNRDMRYLYDQMMGTYPFLPMLKRAGIDWEQRAKDRLSRDYSDYGIHSDIFRKTLDGLMAGALGPYGHARILSSYDYAVRGGGGDWDESAPDLPKKRAMAFDPEGPYKDAKIRAQIGGPVLPPMDLSMEDRSDYLYLRVKSFSLAPSQMADWNDRIFSFYRDYSAYGKPVIIDIRGNGGGLGSAIAILFAPFLNEARGASFRILFRDSPLTREWTEGLEGIMPITEISGPIAHPDDLASFDYFVNFTFFMEPLDGSASIPHGPLYIIQDRGCFSASDALLSWVKATGFATIVGVENSGGDGILFPPLYFKLPNSGFIANISWSCGLNPDGTYNNEVGTAPDILIAAGEDPIQACIKDFLGKGVFVP